MEIDKYELYTRAVQDPPAMVDFLSNIGRECSGRWPHSLREDFGGSFALSQEWVLRETKNSAIVVDNAKEPLASGRQRSANILTDEEQERLVLLKKNVLDKKLKQKTDLICALNFSYCAFKTRKVLRDYLSLCHKRLNPKGVLVLDVLGGIEIANEMTTEAEFPDFHYTWEQVRFNPITREALFHIHFQPNGQRPMRKAFAYDWRIWTVAELRDLLEEVGFKSSYVYWEGSGQLTESDEGPAPGETWVAYVAGRK